MTNATALHEAAELAGAGDWAAARSRYADAVASAASGEALEGLARACWWLGEHRQAVTHAQAGVGRYASEGLPAQAAMLGVHVCVWYLGNFDNEAAARGWLARSRHFAEQAGDPAVEGWVDLMSGYLAGDAETARASFDRAAAAARASADQDLETMALADLGLWHVGRGDVQTGMALLDEAMARTLVGPHRMLEVVVWSSCDMLAACSMVDDLKRASDWCRAADDFIASHGCPFLQARCRAHYGKVLVAGGRWEDAERELARALSMASDTGRGPRTEALAALAELRLRQGDPEAAMVLLEEADPSPSTALTHAGCLLALGRADEARSVLRGQLALSAVRDPALPALVAGLVESELALGNVAAAAGLVGPEVIGSGTPAFPRAIGLLARASGLVESRAGDREAARQQLVLAHDIFLRQELPFEAACTELDLARVLVGIDPAAAVARARSARKQLAAVGARREVAAADDVLRSLGVSTPPAGRSGEALSVREREVLGLLARGMTNPEIGRRLYLSPRTVGHHVSSILRKLGLRSRAEAAAYAARQVSGTAADLPVE